MTQDITDILTRLNRAMMQFDKEAHLVLHRKSGERKNHTQLPGSNHQILSVMSLKDELDTWVCALPIVTENNVDFTFATSLLFDRKNKKKKWVQYRLSLDGMDVTRPASPRLKTASEMMQGAKDRLQEVADNCASEAGNTERWLVDGAGRQNTFIKARSAREAAWSFAALYVRDRREVREWKDTVHKITLLTQVSHPVNWIMPDPDAHNRV
jgi:hypothetical protein